MRQEFDMIQDYTLMARTFRLSSVVVVEFDSDDIGTIRRIEERWNGMRLNDASVCALIRRLNGIIAFYITSLVV